jgi:putative ABC transport system permease protein
MNRLFLAIRLLIREIRSGELTILVLALIIAVTSSTAISLFADRLQRTMTQQAADFLAADLVVSSPRELPKNWHEKAGEFRLNQARTAEFSSVLIENNEMLLAGIKAVSPTYPLRGHLTITDFDFQQQQTIHHGPGMGEAWVEKRILSALKLKLGDMLTVGEKGLTITRIITYEPDKRGDLYSLSPRVMIHNGDLEATRVIQPGSHVHYYFQYSGEADQLLQFKSWVKSRLNPSQRVMDIHEDRPQLGSALERAERYLGLSSIIVILISGVAIAMATRRYTERHFNTTAMLRCLGCKQNEILWLYLFQFLMLGLFASAMGCFAGWLAQSYLFHLLGNLLPAQVANPGWLAVVFGFVTGIVILFGFALPPILRLKRVPPLRVLRRDLLPLPTSAWIVYGLAMSVIVVLVWRYTQDPKMTVIILGVGLLLIIVLGVIVWGLLSVSKHLIPHLNLSWRFALQGLLRNQQGSISQMLAFSITLVAMILTFTVRTDLVDDWQKQLPENAPNHFALNIFADQASAFQQDLLQNNISGSRFYPVVRGRLTAINNIPVQQIVSKDSQGENATHRDLSLTWTDQIPEANWIVAGRWWGALDAEGKPLVSIEQKLAESLDVKLGDILTFTIGSQRMKATVASIRKVQWDTMKPNFYMIFPPGTLNGYAHTFITSFFLPDQKKNLLNKLVKSYPSITVLEVDLILQQLKTILRQLTQAINYLLYFALLAGFMVLFAAVISTLDARIYDGAIMRTLGANRKLLNTTHLLEFILLGFFSGVIALIISEGVLFVLYGYVLHLEYRFNYELWLVVPVLGAFVVGFVGFWGVRKVVNQSPSTVLRDI